MKKLIMLLLLTFLVSCSRVGTISILDYRKDAVEWNNKTSVEQFLILREIKKANGRSSLQVFNEMIDVRFRFYIMDDSVILRTSSGEVTYIL